MSGLELLEAPRSYVATERLVSYVEDLLSIDVIPSGTGSTSVIVTKNMRNEYSLSRLKGLGAHIWQGVDAQKYVNDLRDEWDR